MGLRGGSTRAGLARCSLGRRVCIVVLAIALAGGASVATVWHGDRIGDQDCAVCLACQVRHQSVAELSVNLDVGPADAAELIEQIPVRDRVASDRFSRLPARAPPAC